MEHRERAAKVAAAWPAIALAQARQAGKAAPTVLNQYSITPVLHILCDLSALCGSIFLAMRYAVYL